MLLNRCAKKKALFSSDKNNVTGTYAVTVENVIFYTFLLQAQPWLTVLASKRPWAHFTCNIVQIKTAVSLFGESETSKIMYMCMCINSALICGRSSR